MNDSKWYQVRTVDGTPIGCRFRDVAEAFENCPPCGIVYQEKPDAPPRAVCKSIHGEYQYAGCGFPFNLED